MVDESAMKNCFLRELVETIAIPGTWKKEQHCRIALILWHAPFDACPPIERRYRHLTRKNEPVHPNYLSIYGNPFC
jgi:hypothetical protein